MPLNSVTASIYGKRPRPGIVSGIKDVIALQRVAKSVALDKEAKPSDKCASIRAFVELENLKRILRGHGAPKAVPAANDPAIAKKIGRPRNQAESSDAPAPAGDQESADSPE